MRKPCPQYSLEMERVKKLPEVKQKIEKFQAVFEAVSEHTGKKMKDFADAEDVYSTLLAEVIF